MSILIKQNFLTTLLLFVFLCACSDKNKSNSPAAAATEAAPVSSTSVETPSAAPVKIEKTEKAAISEIKTAPKSSGLAVLNRLTNRADMRPREKTVWQTAVIGTGFFKHDALQTHEAAAANVKYESGSNLDLKENTLIIFDKDPGLNNQKADRVLLKNGELTGATKKELWVFTNAGLVQIKPTKKNQQAQTVLSVNSERKLKVTVKQGSADLILKKNEEEFQKFNLAEKADFEFKAKVSFDIASEKDAVPVNIDLIAKAASEIKKNTAAELVIESPADDMVTTEEQIEVRGKLTEMGAKLLLNGELSEISDDLNFKKTIRLNEGTNLLVFQLVRSDAGVKFYRKNVRYNKK